MTFELGKLYVHKVSDTVYLCVGEGPNGEPILTRSEGVLSMFSPPKEAYDFYEEVNE